MRAWHGVMLADPLATVVPPCASYLPSFPCLFFVFACVEVHSGPESTPSQSIVPLRHIPIAASSSRHPGAGMSSTSTSAVVASLASSLRVAFLSPSSVGTGNRTTSQRITRQINQRHHDIDVRTYSTSDEESIATLNRAVDTHEVSRPACRRRSSSPVPLPHGAHSDPPLLIVVWPWAVGWCASHAGRRAHRSSRISSRTILAEDRRSTTGSTADHHSRYVWTPQPTLHDAHLIRLRSVEAKFRLTSSRC
jgi:hypothetical protein